MAFVSTRIELFSGWYHSDLLFGDLLAIGVNGLSPGPIVSISGAWIGGADNGVILNQRRFS